MTTAGPDTDCLPATAGLWARMAPRFSRMPSRRSAQPFVCEQERLVGSSRWDVNGVRDDVRDWLLEQLDDAEAPRVLVPTNDDALEGGDELLFVAVPEVEAEIEELLAGRTS